MYESLQESSLALEYMPGEVIANIFSYLGFESLINLTLTCRRLCHFALKQYSKSILFYHCYFDKIPQLKSFSLLYPSDWPPLRSPSFHIQPKCVPANPLIPSPVNHDASIPYGTLKANRLETWLPQNPRLVFLPSSVQNLEFTPHQRLSDKKTLTIFNTIGYKITCSLIDPTYLSNLQEVTIRIEFDDAFFSNKEMKKYYNAYYDKFFLWLDRALRRFTHPLMNVRVLSHSPLNIPRSLGEYITVLTCQTTETRIDMVGILWLAAKITALKTFAVSNGGPCIDSKFLPPNCSPDFLVLQLPFTFAKLESLSRLDYMLPLRLENAWLPNSITHFGAVKFPEFLCPSIQVSQEFYFESLVFEVRMPFCLKGLVKISCHHLKRLEINCTSPELEFSDIVLSLVAVNSSLEFLQVPSLHTRALAFVLSNSPKLKVLHILGGFEDVEWDDDEENPTLSSAIRNLAKCPEINSVFLPTFTGQISAADLFAVVGSCSKLESLVFHQIHDFEQYPFDFELYYSSDHRIGCLKEFDLVHRDYAQLPMAFRGKRKQIFLFNHEPPIRRQLIEEHRRSLTEGRYEFFCEYGCFPEEYSEMYRIPTSSKFPARVRDQYNALAAQENDDDQSHPSDMSNHQVEDSDTSFEREQSSGVARSHLENNPNTERTPPLDREEGEAKISEYRPSSPSSMASPSCPASARLKESFTSKSQNENSWAVLYEKPSTNLTCFQKEYYPWPYTFWFEELDDSKESYFKSVANLNEIPHIPERRLRDVVFEKFLNSRCHNNLLIADLQKLREAGLHYKPRARKVPKDIEEIEACNKSGRYAWVANLFKKKSKVNQ